MITKYTCPHCGFAGLLDAFECNGLRAGAYDFTLLCVNRVKPADWAFDHVKPAPDQIGSDGLVSCGMQFCPNVEPDAPALADGSGYSDEDFASYVKPAPEDHDAECIHCGAMHPSAGLLPLCAKCTREHGATIDSLLGIKQ